MILPLAAPAQLEPFIDQLLAKAEGDPAPLVLIRADPASVEPVTRVAGRPVQVRASASPLEIRALASEPRGEPLVVVTSCDSDDLGADLVARALRRRVHPMDRWTTVCQLFGAERPSRRLAQRADLADALLEARPTAGYPPVPARVLDLDTALGALLRAYLGVAEDPTSLAELVAWAETADAANLLRRARPDVLGALTQFLTTRFGPGANAILAAIRAGKGGELMPIALAGGIIHDARLAPAAVDLDHELDRPRLEPAAYRDLASAADQRIRDAAPDPAVVAGWLTRAEDLLARWDAAGEAWRSALLPSGFAQRIARAARTLTAWSATPTDHTLADAADEAISLAAHHRQAQFDPARVERLRMAARLIRRGGAGLPPAGTLAQLVRSYTADGAWFDRARTVVSRRDADPDAAALYDRLTTAADRAREAEGAAVAAIAAGAAHPPSGGLLGVEHVLEQVVAPLADVRPVLLVVLDGMGWPTFTEVLERVTALGWAAHIDPGGGPNGAVLAALPTVTEVSRTSLLAGRLRRGDQGSERRAFAAHPALVDRSRPGRPPSLWHKSDLRFGGLDTLPAEVLSAVGDETTRIVGVVINNIDERLKDVTQPPAGWGLDELAPLGELLSQARIAGRAVVLTADHGHILERHSDARPGTGGERWRRPEDGPPGDGEVLVSGARVVTDDGRAVLPWREQVRYGPSRNGYHGGLTPAELIVPLALLAADELPGWQPTAFPPPPWWHHSPARRPPPPAAAAPAPGRPSPPPATPTLFDVDEVAPLRADDGQWVERVLAADVVRSALPRLRLADDELRRLLVALDRMGGGYLGETRLADEAGLPASRISRYVAQLQRLLNLDGYPVVETRDGEVRLDRALLERQLGIL